MIISNVSQATFDKLRFQLIDTHQADVTGTTEGVIGGHGVIAAYKFDAAAQTLQVDVTHHPFFILVSEIEARLQAAVLSASR